MMLKTPQQYADLIINLFQQIKEQKTKEIHPWFFDEIIHQTARNQHDENHQPQGRKKAGQQTT